MPKFMVTVIKEVREKAWIEIEAANAAAAEAAAVELIEFGDEGGKIEWHYEETPSIDVIKVEQMPEAAE